MAAMKTETQSATDEFQDLFPEAKRRERRRRLLVATVLVAIAGLASGLVALSGGSSSRPPKAPPPAVETRPPMSPKEFLELATKGLGGAYEMTYRVTGDPSLQSTGLLNGSGSVLIAQRSPTSWSFLIRQTNGWVFQWIQLPGSYPARAETCVRWLPRVPTLTCGGPSPNYGANGSQMSMAGFIPRTVVQAIGSAVGAASSKQLTVYSASGTAVTGPLTCMRSTAPQNVGSWCITRSGRVATASSFEQIPFSWKDIELVGYAPAPAASDFSPLAKPTEGEYSVLPV
jgi:hypothetical protein